MPPSDPSFKIRAAHPGEADVLTDIAMESKAYWGYDAKFMEQCRPEMAVWPEHIAHQTVVVAQVQQEIAGFYSLEPDGKGGGEVHKLFVRPAFIGHGIGRCLVDDLCRRASDEGLHALTLDSDPYALGFYEHMGFAVIGHVPSGSIPGRMLPRMRHLLAISADQRRNTQGFPGFRPH